MKKFLSICLMVCVGLILCACNHESTSVVRIHIRANSNVSCDQEVKLMVRDKVVEFITPIIAECKNSNEVKTFLSCNLQNIENVADSVLKDNDFKYLASAQLKNEYFPSRDYDGHVFPADYYDALIIELGAGVGDNWWCVAYPPLCFVGEEIEGSGVKYKSKLVELINKYFG